MRRPPVGVLAVALAFGAGAQPAWPGSGRVEVRVTDHRAGIGDFRTLHVGLAEVALHPEGQPRDRGWRTVVRRAAAVDLVPLKDGRWAAVATAAVEAARYDAVRVRFGSAAGVLERGGAASVTPIGTTVRVDLAVAPDATRALVIDLYVEDQGDHAPGRYAVKVRGVAVGSP